MDTWMSDQNESFLVAEAETGPIASVTQTLFRYRNWMRRSRKHGYFLLSTDSSADYEAAVHARQDSYLNLLLAGAAADTKTVLSLWDWSESCHHSPIYKAAIRNEILSGPGMRTVLKEKNFFSGSEEQSRISVIDLLRSEKIPGDAYLILKNPFFKDLMDDLLERNGSFETIPESSMLQIVSMCADNPAFNQDTSDEHGPDLTHWSISKSVFKLLNDTPANDKNLWSVYHIVERMHPEVFNATGFPIIDFCSRWRDLENSVNEKTASPAKQEGIYTDLTRGEELASMFAAKFGSSLLTGKKMTVAQGLEEPDLLKKAAFFGTRYFDAKEVRKILDSWSPQIIYWLIFNKSALSVKPNRDILREVINDTFFRGHFQRRLEWLETINPDAFSDDINTISVGDSTSLLTAASVQTQKLSSQIEKIVLTLEGLKEQFKTIFYFLILFGVVLLVKNIF